VYAGFFPGGIGDMNASCCTFSAEKMGDPRFLITADAAGSVASFKPVI
jgi:hypothetical protein